MVDAKDISPSQGESADDLAAQTTTLVDQGRWKLWNDGKGLERQFKFKTFKATWVRSLISAKTCPSDELTDTWKRIL